MIRCATILMLLGASAGAEIRFPPLSAKDLSGVEVALPEGMKGSPNVIFVAFRREGQTVIDTWLKAMAPIEARFPAMRYYEFPVIGPLNRLGRFFLDNAMRAGIPDKAQRSRTITLYGDKESFKRSMEILDEALVYVYVMDSKGLALWKETGAFTAEKGAALQAKLASLIAP